MPTGLGKLDKPMGPCKLRQYLSQLNLLKLSRNLCSTWHPQHVFFNFSVDSKWEHLQSAAVLIDNTDLARRLQLLVVNVEDIQYHGLKSICGYEAMVGSQQATFIVAPSLDL